MADRDIPYRNFVEVFPQTPIVPAPADYAMTPPAALIDRQEIPVPGRPHGGLVMDLFCALNDGDWLPADDTDFIEDVARRLWALGWRHPTLTATDQAHLHDPTLLSEWTARMNRTIAIDFDGTLHPYTGGWQGSMPIDEPPIPGALQAVRDLQDLGFRVVIFSVRADHEEGLHGIVGWLDRYGFTGLEITHLKPPAVAYIDDRAVRFRGDWAAAVEEARQIADGTSLAVADPAPDA